MKNTIICLLISLFAFSACNLSTQNNGEDDGHDHEKIKIKITAYSDDFELFAEADPFVVDKTSSILAHFSHLNNFKALSDAKVTAKLIVGTKGIRQSVETPERPGIYLFNLQPSTVGAGKIIFEIENPDGDISTISDSVFVYSDEHTAIHEVEEGASEHSNGVVFTKEQSWKTDFATGFPRIEPFGPVIKTTALVGPAQNDEVIISAGINGVLNFSESAMLEGRNVSEGEVLLSVSGSEMAEDNSSVRFTEAKNNFETVKANYDRAKELAKDKIVSEKDLLIAKNRYERGESIYNNLSRNFNASGQQVTSPMSGFVSRVFVTNGTYVEAGSPVLKVAQNNNLLLTADIQRKYASVLESIRSANISAMHDDRVYSLEELDGKILSYGKTGNEDNFLIPVHLQVKNTGYFTMGGFVEVYLKTMTNPQALTVPNASLMEDQGYFSVYVQVTPELFVKRDVKVGKTDGLRTEILSGITSDDRIVTKGAIRIKLAQSGGTLDAHSGHVH